MTNRASRFALAFGVAVPLLYFGAQLAAAPFFPGFSVLRHSASMLGSDLSTRPEILNTGAMLTGLATLISVIGFARALKVSGAHSAIVWLVCIALVSSGLASLWASSFPLPDRRHNPGPLSLGMFVLPALFFMASLRLSDARGIRVYGVADGPVERVGMVGPGRYLCITPHVSWSWNMAGQPVGATWYGTRRAVHDGSASGADDLS